jgi:hypothetical protein
MASKNAATEKTARVSQPATSGCYSTRDTRNLNIRAGDYVAFTRKANGVLIRPKRVAAADDTALSSTEVKQVRSAVSQIKAGRFKLWRDVKHELGR